MQYIEKPNVDFFRTKCKVVLILIIYFKPVLSIYQKIKRKKCYTLQKYLILLERGCYKKVY